MANLVQRVSSAVVVLQIQSTAPDPPTGARGVAPEPPPAITRLVPGARIAGDLALVHVPSGFQVTGGQGLAAPVEVLRADDDRQIALVRAPSVLEITSVLANPFEGFPGFSYVGVVEAAIGGVTAKPMFAGRADRSTDARWPHPVVVVGGSSDLPPGALVFALDGRFIGLAMPFDADNRALVPAAALSAVREALAKEAAAPTGGKAARSGSRKRGGLP